MLDADGNEQPAPHTCGSIVAHVYEDEYCSSGKWNEAKSQELQAKIDADISANSCRPYNNDQDWHRYVCDDKSMRHSVFTQDDCSESYLTYSYEWHKCVLYDADKGLYVYLKSALALKTTIIGGALALIASQFWVLSSTVMARTPSTNWISQKGKSQYSGQKFISTSLFVYTNQKAYQDKIHKNKRELT